MKIALALVAPFLFAAPALAQDGAPRAAPSAAEDGRPPTPTAPPAAAPAGEAAGSMTPLGAVRRRDELRPDPEDAYIFYRTTRRLGLVFLREISPADEAAEQEKALTAAQAQYRIEAAQWQQDYQACLIGGPNDRHCRRVRDSPVPPTADDVSADLEPDRNIVEVYQNATFSDDRNSYTYLVAVLPGSYVLYGQRDANGTGVCLCMGSVRFDVAPGQVVDLGIVTFPGLEAAAARPGVRLAMTDGGQPSIRLTQPPADVGVPARLAGFTIVPARLRAADKMANFFGLYIDRYPATENVIRYERDLVIDPRTGSAPAPPS